MDFLGESVLLLAHFCFTQPQLSDMWQSLGLAFSNNVVQFYLSSTAALHHYRPIWSTPTLHSSEICLCYFVNIIVLFMLINFYVAKYCINKKLCFRLFKGNCINIILSCLFFMSFFV